MELKKNKRGDYLFQESLRFSKPYVSTLYRHSVCIEINLSEIVDGYAYHDFPSAVSIYLGKEGLLELREIISGLLEEMEKLDVR